MEVGKLFTRYLDIILMRRSIFLVLFSFSNNFFMMNLGVQVRAQAELSINPFAKYSSGSLASSLLLFVHSFFKEQPLTTMTPKEVLIT